jgi:hypothetical protein
MSRPRARHLVLVVAGTVLIGTGLAWPSGQPRAEAPDFGASAAAATTSAPPASPQPTAVPPPVPVPPPAPAPVPAAPPAPTAITLPGAAQPAPLVPVGVLSSGALQLPERPTVLGWFAAGAVPGDAVGSAVIAGHIDSAEYGAGPMEGLLALAEGDVVEVTDAAGGVHRYAVASRSSYPKSAGGVPADVFRLDGPPQLALVSCGGAFDQRTGNYADNIVVLATPVT